MHTRLGLSGVSDTTPGPFSAAAYTVKIGQEESPVMHDWGRTAAVKGGGRTCAGLRMRWGPLLPGGVRRGGGSVLPFPIPTKKGSVGRRSLPLVGSVTVLTTVLGTQQPHR